MINGNEFLMPDYFPDFSCKMGACRNACCCGWPITISMKNYFTLLGAECSPDLRRKIDCSMHILDNPSEYAYAHLEPRYDGNCAMRADDGRCALQLELGEHVLPDVCRLYPRGIRSEEYGCECSCANSCEAVLEIFLNKKEPIAFIKKKLSLDIPENIARRHRIESFGIELPLRMLFTDIMQDRKIPLNNRLLKLGEVFKRLEKAALENDRESFINTAENIDTISVPPAHGISNDRIAWGLDIIRRLISGLEKHSRSIHDHCADILALFEGSKSPVDRYSEMEEKLKFLLPNNEIFLEHILVNHMFFSQFPFQDRPESPRDEFIAISVVYMILRFLILAWAVSEEHPSKEKLIDTFAAAFRLISHTEFERYAAYLLKQLNCDSDEKLFTLIGL